MLLARWHYPKSITGCCSSCCHSSCMMCSAAKLCSARGFGPTAAEGPLGMNPPVAIESSPCDRRDVSSLSAREGKKEEGEERKVCSVDFKL